MMCLRRVFLLAVVSLILIFLGHPVSAAVNITTSWERPVKFKVTDVSNAAALSQPLLIIMTEKHVEGNREPIPFYDVIKGSNAGLADYRVGEKSSVAEVRILVPGYVFSMQKVLWTELPPREMDSSGFEKSVPTVTLALKPLSGDRDWQREFRLVIAPELEDLLQLKPPYLSKDEHRAINEFLNSERNRMLGL